MPTYSQPVLIEMLNAGFFESDIKDLAMEYLGADHLFGEGMNKGERIRVLVGYAAKQGRVEPILEFVKERNPAVFAEFEGRLARPAVYAGLPADFDVGVIRPYLEKVVRECQHLRLTAIDPAGNDANLSLGDVFVSLTGERVTSVVSVESGRKIEIYWSAIAHVYYNDQLIILGDPGSGKSTLLRHLATVFCNALLQERFDHEALLSWETNYEEIPEQGMTLEYQPLATAGAEERVNCV